jgi:hypothetical protein
MIPYILHVTVITTACFLFYKLLLQKETFYLLNRWTLLGCLAVSFALPLLPVPRDWSWRSAWMATPVRPVAPPVKERVEPQDHEPAVRDKEVDYASSEVPLSAAMVKPVKQPASRKAQQPGTGKPAESVPAVTGSAPAGVSARSEAAFPATQRISAEGTAPERSLLIPILLQWLFYLYLSGVLIFGGNFLLQMAVLLYQSYARPAIRDGRFRIVEIRGNRAPCSFGNTIFINPCSYDWDTYNQILIHEKVHVSGRHTLDLLLAEMAVVFQWFNPFAWLYRREVETNLEFLTDASVLEQVERRAYQLSLLRVSAPHLPFSITNNYNQSLLKRRIVMMNSKRSSLHTIWKYFFLVPLLTGLVCALNEPVAYGAGAKEQAHGGVNGDRSGGQAAKPASGSLLRMTGTAAVADTGSKPKPRPDSSRWWDAPVAVDVPSVNVTINDASGTSVQQKMMLDQAMQNAQIATTQLAPQMALNDQMAKATLARLDMAAPVAPLNLALAQTNVTVAAPMVNVDVNVRDIRITGDTDVLEGAWFATSFSGDNKLRFELKRESESGSWNNSFEVDKNEFHPYPGQGTVEFKLTREAGTIVFKGQFDGQEGFGHFFYTPDEGYFAALKQMGIEDIEGRRFAYFALNIKKDYAAMLVHAYPHLSSHNLISCAALHIDADFIKYWQGSGIAEVDDPHSLVALKAMHIDRAYVDELKAAGYDHIPLHELTALKAQHIDGAYIRSLGRGKDNEPIPLRELITYKAMHIDSGYIASLRSVGYSGLERNQLISLYSQHITAAFIKSFQDAGYANLSAHDLISLKAMGITPELIKGWRDLGYEDISPSRLGGLKAMGVTPDFVREFNKIGFDHIPVNMLTMLKSMGVNAEYVSKMKEKGFVSKDLGKYIRLKNDFN